MRDTVDDLVPPIPPESREEMTLSFRADVGKYAGGTAGLGATMIRWGDYRSSEAIARSLQRVMSGDIRVSGEMCVIMTAIRQNWLRSERLVHETVWIQHDDLSVTAEVADFSVTIYPATKGRWRSNLVHKSGYSPSWPTWQNNIEDAKRAAVHRLVKAQIELDEVWAYANLPEA